MYFLKDYDSKREVGDFNTFIFSPVVFSLTFLIQFYDNFTTGRKFSEQIFFKTVTLKGTLGF